MRGTNPRLPFVKPVGSANLNEILVVREVFRTIQGEGPLAGRPALFVRLAGCHLACSFCDTDFDVERSEPMQTEDLYERVRSETIPGDLVVLTGGEPMRQPIEGFVHRLTGYGLDVQVETAGSFWRELWGYPGSGRRITVVCSPKTKHVDANLRLNVDAWKYVVGSETELDDETGLPVDVWRPDPRRLQKGMVLSDRMTPPNGVPFAKPVYLQPMDEGDEATNRANMERCVKLCMYHGYRLSIQQHKVVGLP